MGVQRWKDKESSANNSSYATKNGAQGNASKKGRLALAVNSKIATIAKKGELTTQEKLIKSAYAESEISGKFPQSK